MPAQTTTAPAATETTPEASTLEAITTKALGRLKGKSQRQLIRVAISVDMDKWAKEYFPADIPTMRAIVNDHVALGALLLLDPEGKGIVAIDKFESQDFERGVEGYGYEADLNVFAK